MVTSDDTELGLRSSDTQDASPSEGPRASPAVGDSLAETLAASVTSDAPTELGGLSPVRRRHAAARSVLGRYVLRERLGTGAAGTVFEAFDPSLERAVAVKVLHAGLGTGAGARMQREALALARLSHPNVVQVFEVGEAEGQTFIAMELVRGQTLAAWARREARPTWQECVDVYMQVGAGLVAAHAAGIVHRDLKPSNCIIGDDGRVRVVDFGLAKGVGVDGDEDTSTSDGRSSVDEALTQHGALLGTPAYMAPEQLASRPGSPASDQLALCVSLWEAVYGQRPFLGKTMPELVASILAGSITEPPAGARVPRWLRAVLERGLRMEPSQRWPSVAALLEALARGRSRARFRRIAWVAGLALTTLGAALAWERWDVLARTRACEAEGAAIATVWGPGAALALHEAMLGTGLPRAQTTVDAVLPWLDAQAQAWQTATVDACLRGQVHGSWDDDTLARAQWCLDERRLELAALVDELGTGRVDALDAAVDAASTLRPVDPCLDAAGLARLPTPPSDAREDVDALRVRLSRVEASLSTGAYAAAHTQAEQALAQAQELGWPPLVATAQYDLARALEHQGEYTKAERSYEDAFFEAADADALEVAASAAGALAFLVGCVELRYDDGRLWVRQEDLVVSRLPDAGGWWRINALANRGLVHKCEGSLTEAEQEFEQVFEEFERTLGPDHPRLSNHIANLATVRHALGNYAEAKDLALRAIALREAGFGPEHPTNAEGYSILMAICTDLGEYEEAERHIQHAIEIQTRAGGLDHPQLAIYLGNLAGLYQTIGALERAEPVLERAVAINERAYGREHPRLATNLGNLALLRSALGRPAEARALLERVVQIRESEPRTDHRDLATALLNLGATEQTLKHLERARSLLERALAIQEVELGRDHPDVAGTLTNLANVLVDEGDYAEAEPMHERARAIFERALGHDHQYVAMTLLNLGIVYEKTERPAEARAAYEEALRIWERALGHDHPNTALAYVGLATVALGQGETVTAIEPAETALRLLAGPNADPTALADARFVLGRALWQAGRDRARARTLVEQARATCVQAGDTGLCKLAALDRWLAAHAAPSG